MADPYSRTLAGAPASAGERRIINQTLPQSNARFSNTRFDQTFDGQATAPNRANNASGLSNRDLGGILKRDQSHERMTPSGLIAEDMSHHTNSRAALNKTSASRGNLNDLAGSAKLEESVAAHDRPPRRVAGLTAFLRREYYRKLGVYINRSRGESDKLKQFWKDHVSETYKKIREKQSMLRSSVQPGTATFAAGTQASAVPSAGAKKTAVDKEYEAFQNCFELDVDFTILRDLEDETADEKVREVQNQSQYELQMTSKMLASDLEQLSRMLRYYFFGPPTVVQVDKVVDKVPVRDAKGKIVQEKKLKEPEVAGANAPQYQFMEHLCRIAREQNKLTEKADPYQALAQTYAQNMSKFQWPRDEKSASALLKDFFSDSNFVKRVKLHQQHICKSKLKQNSIITLYYKEMTKQDKVANLVWLSKGYELLQQHVKSEAEHQKEKERLAQLEKKVAMAKAEKKPETEIAKIQQEDTLVQQLERATAENNYEEQQRIRKELKTLQQKREVDQQRIERLAMPKDQWRLTKQLVKLRKEFPHDRCLERMIQEEMAKNQAFRHPSEYDVFNKQKDEKLKQQQEKFKGMRVPESEFGTIKLEEFRQTDQADFAREKQKTIQQTRAKKAFEAAIIQEACNYIQGNSNRLKNQMAYVQEDSATIAEREKAAKNQTMQQPAAQSSSQEQNPTVRQKLCDIYHRLLAAHGPYVKSHFPVISYGMNKKGETFKKFYPNTFARCFFRYVKAISNKQGTKLDMKQIQRRYKLLATAFIIPSGVNTTTHNKKVVLTKALRQKVTRVDKSTRSKIFFREDMKARLGAIFMTYDEQLNCTFEPQATKYKTKNQKHEEEKEAGPKTYAERQGTDFQIACPEIYKAGMLKKAKLFKEKGKYDDALNCLTKSFNIGSLRRNFEPDFFKKEQIQKAVVKEAMANALQKKKDGDTTKKEEKKTGIEALAHLREEVADVQKNMPAEDFTKGKLLPILEEAYHLWKELDTRKERAEKECKRIEKVKQKMIAEKKTAMDATLSRDDPDEKAQTYLFKTIMCPLGDACSKVRKARFPKSSIKSVTQFGAMCPYAHHYMELVFPETHQNKINATNNMKKNVMAKVDSASTLKHFVPAGVPLSGRHLEASLAKQKTHEQEVRAKMKKILEKTADANSVEYQKEMEEIKTKMKVDENYCKKYGLLRKASILAQFGRFNEAHNEAAKAVEIIRKQKVYEQQKFEAIQRRWRFKLGLDEGFELPADEKEMAEHIQGNSAQLATIKKYAEMVKPEKMQEGSKDNYLNGLIEEFFMEVEAKIQDKMDNITRMRENVTKLGELEEQLNMLGDENDPGQMEEMIGDDGKPIRFKPVKTKMCKKLLEKGKCNGIKDKSCKFAHNPIELTGLISVGAQMKNLQGVIKTQNKKLKNNQVMESWIPAGKVDPLSHTPEAPMRKSKGRDKKDDDANEDKPKSIFERENIFRKPFEEKD